VVRGRLCSGGVCVSWGCRGPISPPIRQGGPIAWDRKLAVRDAFPPLSMGRWFFTFLSGIPLITYLAQARTFSQKMIVMD